MHIVGGAAAGDNLVQRTFANQDNQKWSITRVDDYDLKDGIYVITSQKSGLALELEACETGNSVGLKQNPVTKSDCQQWEIKSTDDGFYTLTSVMSGKALDIPGCSAIPGERIRTWDALGNDCQKFRIIPHGLDGSFKIISKTNGLSFDVAGCSEAADANILQYLYWGASCQLWDFEAILITDQSKSLKGESLAVYPNPATDRLTVRGLEDGTAVEVYDLSGQEVLSSSIQHGSVDISVLQPGAYVLKVDGNVQSFIKQ
jgi:hypothetical protein